MWVAAYWPAFIEHPRAQQATEVGVWLRLFLLPAILLAGFLGNGLTMALMRRPSMRGHSYGLLHDGFGGQRLSGPLHSPRLLDQPSRRDFGSPRPRQFPVPGRMRGCGVRVHGQPRAVLVAGGVSDLREGGGGRAAVEECPLRQGSHLGQGRIGGGSFLRPADELRVRHREVGAGSRWLRHRLPARSARALRPGYRLRQPSAALSHLLRQPRHRRRTLQAKSATRQPSGWRFGTSNQDNDHDHDQGQGVDHQACLWWRERHRRWPGGQQMHARDCHCQ